MKEEKEQCAHCKNGIGLKYVLNSSKNFWIVCDAHPLIEGHILIIPKEHISCMGALNEKDFEKYKELYAKVLLFLQKNYGNVGIFEHGRMGQTVFHAHTHFLPFNKSIEKIVPENNSVKTIFKIDELKTEFRDKGNYLFVALNNQKWLVNIDIGYTEFFRTRFANLLNVSKRGNWKKAEANEKLMNILNCDIHQLKNKWAKYFNREKSQAKILRI